MDDVDADVDGLTDKSVTTCQITGNQKGIADQTLS